MSSDPSDLKKHKLLILETKLEILNKLNQGERGSSLARQYGCSKSTVSEIKRKADVLLQFASTTRAEDGLKRRKTLRMASNIALEEEVYRWFTERREAGDTISGVSICEKAREINEKLGGSPEFKASSGWLKNFKVRHNIKLHELIIADFTAKVAKNNEERVNKSEDNHEGKSSHLESSPLELDNSASEMQCIDEINNQYPVRIKTERTYMSDSELDIQFGSESSSDATSQSKASFNIDDVEQGYTVTFPTVTTFLQPPDQGNFDATDEDNTNEKGDPIDMTHIIIKEEKVDVYDNESVPVEDDPLGLSDNYTVGPGDKDALRPSDNDALGLSNNDALRPCDNDAVGPSDKDALIALNTAINWMERQPDRIPSQLNTLRNIREFAMYKERLRSLTRGPKAFN